MWCTDIQQKSSYYYWYLLKPFTLLPLSWQWLVRSKAVSERQEACWDLVTQMKGDVLALLDSENDGVRTHAIKFTESLIITLSPRTSDSDVPKRQEGDISLDKVPKDHSYIRYGTDYRILSRGHSLFKGKVCYLSACLPRVWCPNLV